MEHLEHFKPRSDLAPPTRRSRRSAFVRGLHPVWIRDPFENLVMGVSSTFTSDEERIIWSEIEWSRIWTRHLRPLELSRQARLVLGWRLTRLLAQHAGIAGPETPLSAIPWQAWHAPGPVHQKEVLLQLPLQHYWPDSRTQLTWKARIPDDYSHWLRPPPETAPDDYKNTWKAFVQFAVTRHHMHQGVEADPTLGRLGVYMLLDDRFEGKHWPVPEEIQDFEEALVFKVLELLTGQQAEGKKQRRVVSRLGVVREVQEEFNLTLPEAKCLVILARGMALEMTSSTPEQDKAMLVLQNERLAEDAILAGDLRNEATAYKTLAQIQGLTRGEDFGGMEEVIDAMTSVTNEQKTEDEALYLQYLQEEDE